MARAVDLHSAFLSITSSLVLCQVEGIWDYLRDLLNNCPDFWNPTVDGQPTWRSDDLAPQTAPRDAETLSRDRERASDLQWS